MNEKQDKNNFMERVAAFIVDKRKAFYLIFIAAIIYSVLSISKVAVNDDITSYLPEDTETKQGLDRMEDQFTTFGTSRVMVSGITFSEAEELAENLEDIEGVTSAEFIERDDDGNIENEEDIDDYYKDSSALFSITYDGEAEDEICKAALEDIENLLSGYDYYISGDVGGDSQEDFQNDMKGILLLAVIVIVAVLFITSKTYMEIPVMLITFATAAILNKGTNYWFGEISFVTDSIAVILQLALAIDYAIILCHRYMEEHETKDAREAAIAALSKAIPEISSSSLTTVSGMVAMMFMQYRLGFDMGIVLTKSILFSLITVFLLMPGLLIMFSKLIDKTHHKSFVPKINFLGKFVYKSRYIVPPIFIIVIAVALVLQSKCAFIYDTSSIESSKKSESKIAQEAIDEKFGANNVLAVLVPKGSYEKETALVRDFEKMDKVEKVLSLANVEIKDEYYLLDKLTPRQFSELADLDIEIARFMYSAYAIDQEKYGPVISGIDEYRVPIFDMFMFLYEQKQEGYVELEDDLNEELDDMYKQLHDGEIQLKGDKYTRIVLSLDLPIEGEETFDYLEKIRAVANKYYDDDVYLVGNSTADKDLASSFISDNVIITVLTALFVMVILLFTFKSAGLPILLVMAIQGSIWINFSFPYLTNSTMFFISQLIISAIQMGATIDYAIVITSRYMELKQYMPIKEAMIESLNQAFPTIFTSGTILTAAGFIIGNLSSDAAVASIGISLGRGTFISIVIVMCVLPQILLFGDSIIEKTAFTLKREFARPLPSGRMRVNGHVKGYVNGMIDAEISGTIRGDVNAVIELKNNTADVEELPLTEDGSKDEEADENDEK